MINVIDAEGKVKIKISDENDQKKDIVVQDGVEVPYEEAAKAKEKEIKDSKKE